jgi:hypothetical protein
MGPAPLYEPELSLRCEILPITAGLNMPNYIRDAGSDASSIEDSERKQVKTISSADRHMRRGKAQQRRSECPPAAAVIETA